ncbi:hypothetical protein PLESTF_000576100 [Pleodorina starrii]|nr:hypothetical protein PLESTF_000576100 [Pleodorina starrii]
MCEWLVAHGCPIDQEALCSAARGGHEDLGLRQHLTTTVVDDKQMLTAAAASFGLRAFAMVYDSFLARRFAEAQDEFVIFPTFPSALAAAAGSTTPDWQDKVELLEGLGYPRHPDACAEAAAQPDAVDRLEWLLRRGYPLTDRAVEKSASAGNLAALRFLLEQQQHVWSPSAAVVGLAAFNGQLEILQYFHSRDPRSVKLPTVLLDATHQDHLPVVEWALVTLPPAGAGAPVLVSEQLSRWATVGGSLEMLEWLRERGWSLTSERINAVADGGSEMVLEWLVESGCPMPTDGHPYLLAARNGDLAMASCLHRLGCPWGRSLVARCIGAKCPVQALRQLAELGCPVALGEAERALAHVPEEPYRSELLAWLGEERLLQTKAGVL